MLSSTAGYRVSLADIAADPACGSVAPQVQIRNCRIASSSAVVLCLVIFCCRPGLADSSKSSLQGVGRRNDLAASHGVEEFHVRFASQVSTALGLQSTFGTGHKSSKYLHLCICTRQLTVFYHSCSASTTCCHFTAWRTSPTCRRRLAQLDDLRWLRQRQSSPCTASACRSRYLLASIVIHPDTE